MREPIAMSFQEFMGQHKRLDKPRTLPAEDVLELVMLAQPIGEGELHGAYRIHEALFAANPHSRQLKEWKHGKKMAVAVYEDTTSVLAPHVIVGLVNFNTEWVNPDHRGHGLGAAVSVKYLLLMGGAQWTRAQWATYNSQTRSFTEAGWKNRRKVFDLLIERGIFVERA